jgi:hypothetical protein
MFKDTTGMSAEELQTYVKELEATLWKNKKPSAEPTFMVSYDGDFQIRGYIRSAINIPADVVKFLFTNGQKVLSFLSIHADLLTLTTDGAATVAAKQTRRDENLSTEIPIVKKPHPRKELVSF